MPRSLKQTAEPDTFDFGKAVTLVLSQVKELNKTRNTLVEDIQYLESRKKQEKEAIERITADKESLIQLKQELTQKIISEKSKFMEDVSAKRQELAIKEADLISKSQNFAEYVKKVEQEQALQQSELDIRNNDHKKEWQDSMEILSRREVELIAREETVTKAKADQEVEQSRISSLEAEIHKQSEKLQDKIDAQNNKKLELDNRETTITKTESELVKQRKNLAQLAADLESQVRLVESERSKNRTEMESIRVMQKNLYDKKAELDNRELHIKDREATVLTR